MESENMDTEPTGVAVQPEVYRNLLRPEPAKPASEITKVDRDRILGLIETEETRRLGENTPTYQERKANTIPFRRKLRMEGPTAATVILDSINHPLDRFSAYDYIELCAGEENGDEIIDHLINFGQLIYMDSMSLNRTAQRITNASHIPKLQEYVGDDSEPDGYIKRVRTAAEIALAAEQRATDPDEKQRLLDFVDQLSKITISNGKHILNSLDREIIREQTQPGLLALRLAEEFYADEPDPDLDYRKPETNPEVDASRVDIVRNLYALAEEQVVMNKGESIAHGVLEKLAFKELPSPYAVTVGIEVEIEKQSLIETRLTKGRDMRDREAIASAKLTNLHRATSAGLPKAKENGPDIIREYAFLPAHYYATLAREVQQLMAMDLVSPDYKEHPLHLTIGDVTSKGPKGQGAYLLARCLESSGWCCSGERLRRPLNEYGSWTYKGKGGIRERHPSEIIGQAQSAVEFRTLSLQSLSGFDRTLRSAQSLGSALSAYQMEGERDETQQQLAEIWEDFSVQATPIFEEFGIDAPGEDWEASEALPQSVLTHPKAHMSPNFIKLADLLDQAEASPDSDGARFQNKLQQAILDARGKVMGILSGRG